MVKCLIINLQKSCSKKLNDFLVTCILDFYVCTFFKNLDFVIFKKN